MKRKVHQVRKQIKKRKMNQKPMIKQESTPWPQRPSFFVSEEEKHGYERPILLETNNQNVTWRGKRNKRKVSSSMLKFVLSIVLFVGAFFILQNNHSKLSATQDWLSSQLQDEFPFAKVNAWYVATFGSPLALSPQGKTPALADNQSKALPVLGHVVETFSATGTGIMISPEKRSMVTALDEGIVIFAGNDEETKKTVVIQHADGSNTTYGYLSATDVHLYQAVQANQMIGSFTPTEENEFVYFSIEKDDQFIDPSQVVPVNDIP